MLSVKTARFLICVQAAALAVSCTTPVRTEDTPKREVREPVQPAVLRAVPSEPVQPGVLHVGPSRELRTPSAAARVARDGNVVEIDAGVYPGDAAVWRQQRLTLRGVGGRAYLRADGAQAEGKGIWVIKGNGTTVESIELSGAKVPDRNGAAIRLEGAGLTVRDCYIHDNENGILTGVNPASDVVVERTELARNGAGDGYTHNLYIGDVRSFALRYSYVHHAVVGHNVKSRAARNDILYNRIMDERDGRSSYAIDLPNGGLSFVIGNLIQHGADAENSTVVSYGTEGFKHPSNELYFVSNTVVNDRPAGGRFLSVKAGAGEVRILNNVFAGRGEVLVGPGEAKGNVVAARRDFVDLADFDYRLKAGAAAIGAGIDPGSAHGVELRPTAEYVHRAGERARGDSGKLDAGALAYRDAR